MTLTEILGALKTERGEMQKQVEQGQLAAKRIVQIESAINALEGRVPPANGHVPRTGRPIIDMIEGAARDLAGNAFDYKSLTARAAQLFPDSTAKIKRGVYSAVALLLKKNTIRRCPGGFTLTE